MAPEGHRMVTVAIVEGLAILLLGVLVAGLLRSHADILRGLHQLGLDMGGGNDRDRGASGSPPGTTSPVRIQGARANDIVGVTLEDEAIGVAVGREGGDTVLAFLSSGCETCANFWSDFRNPSLAVPGGARLVVVAKDADQESPSRLRSMWAEGSDGVALVLSSQGWNDYQVPGAPYFIYVHGDTGRVLGEGTGASWRQVSSLLAQALADSRTATQATGDPVEQELLTAGIGPGHPSLYGPPESDRVDS